MQRSIAPKAGVWDVVIYFGVIAMYSKSKLALLINVMKERMQRIHLESRSRKALISFSRKAHLRTLSTCFFVFLARLYDIHVTRFNWFLRREGDSAPHSNKLLFSGQTQNETKNLKTLWEQGGPLVFRGPYAACVFCVKGGSALHMV